MHLPVSRSQCRTLPSLLARKVRNHIVLQAFYIEALFELANLGETEDMDVSDASGRLRSAS